MVLCLFPNFHFCQCYYSYVALFSKQIPINQAIFMMLIKIDYRKFDGWKRLMYENVLTLTSPTSYLAKNGIVPFSLFSLCQMLLHLCCIFQHNWGRGEERRSSQRPINQARFMILIKIDYRKFDGWKRLTCENVLTLTSTNCYLVINGIVPIS